MIQSRLITLFAIVTFMSCSDNHLKKENQAWDQIARKEMVDGQIKARGITDEKVINAMLKVGRHKFVRPEYERSAYDDCPLPIGEGQTISQPYIVALMTEKLGLNGREKVLEIGTGSGYQAAILSLIVKEVYTIELIPTLAHAAAERLKNLGFNNVSVRCGDGFLGWADAAPFDAIIITCALAEIPKPLMEQLAEGGRLIAPLGDEFQMLTIFKKVEGKLERKEITPVIFVPMKGMIEEK